MPKRYDQVFLESLYKRVDIDAFLDRYHANVTNHEVMTHRGREIRMHCLIPGHRDNSASASLNMDTGLYKCWSKCGGFSFWKLVQELENLPNFPAAVDVVRSWVGMSDDDEIDELQLIRERFSHMRSMTEDPMSSLTPRYVDVDLDGRVEFHNALDHMDAVRSRVNEEMIRTWDLKYAVSGYYEGRLIVPFKVDGRTVSFAARDMLGRAERWKKINERARERGLTRTEIDDLKRRFAVQKIIYPPTVARKSGDIVGSPTAFILFNIDEASRLSTELGKDYVILTEGPFDAMQLHCWGFPSVALLGLKLSAYKRKLVLSKFSRIYVCLDNDDKTDGSNPGQDAAMEIVRSLIDNVSVHNIILPRGKDPDDCDPGEFQSCLASAEEL